MDLIIVLERFNTLSIDKQAWIMATLLDFRQQNLDRFKVCHGTYANELIDSLTKE